MIATATENPTVVRTGRGLTIKGTRLTLYDIMDYLQAERPREEILNMFPQITASEFDDVLAYIAAHREEVEAEYQEVLKRAEEIRHYWEERNRDRVKPIDPATLSPERRALWEKHQAWKEQIRRRDQGTD